MKTCRVPGCNKRTILQLPDGQHRQQPGFVYCWKHATQFKKFMNQVEAKVRSFESSSVYPMGQIPTENRVYGYEGREGT